MSLYKVTDSDAPNAKPRLVKAASKAVALRHVAGQRFTIETMTDPTTVAELMDNGVSLEDVGTAPLDPSHEEDTDEGVQTPNNPPPKK